MWSEKINFQKFFYPVASINNLVYPLIRNRNICHNFSEDELKVL